MFADASGILTSMVVDARVEKTPWSFTHLSLMNEVQTAEADGLAKDLSPPLNWPRVTATKHLNGQLELIRDLQNPDELWPCKTLNEFQVSN